MFTVVVPLSTEGQESGQERGAEIRAESLAGKLINMLSDGPKLKSEIAHTLGRERVTGQINHVVNNLIASDFIERTIPGKPTSRYQQYRLTQEGGGLGLKGIKTVGEGYHPPSPRAVTSSSTSCATGLGLT